jgi:hypothetical protein
MNPKSTWLWLVTAGVLFAFIVLAGRYLHKPPPGPARVLAGLNPAEVTAIKVLTEGHPQIRASLTNGTWRLQPSDYPASRTNIETLLAQLQSLTAPATIFLEELKGRENADAEFGLASPQASLVIQQGDYRPEILVGSLTPQGNQVFVQVVNSDGIYVADAAFLKWIPHTIDDWRDTAFGNFGGVDFDHVIATNAGAVLELQRETNKLWSIVQPNPVRADTTKVEEALQQLQAVRASGFLPDDSPPDFDALGLRPPDLDFQLCRGTNVILRLQFGRSPTNRADEVYARRSDRPGVALVLRDPLAAWRGSYVSFRDHHLLNLAAPVDRIAIHAQDEFTLERRGSNSWEVLPQGFPADAGIVQELLRELADLQAVDFPQDVVNTAPDLSRYGLNPPAMELILQSSVTNAAGHVTNSLVAQLDFGVRAGKVYARRADEQSVYGIDPTNYNILPAASLQMREHRIWNFSEEDVSNIRFGPTGAENEFDRLGTNHWQLGQHSNGMITEFTQFGIEETVRRLGELTASVWVGRGTNLMGSCGLGTNSLRLEVSLKDGRNFAVNLGGEGPAHYHYASVVLDAEPWIFEMGPAFYEDILAYLVPQK